MALLLAVLAASAAAETAREQVTPTQKVIQLLDGMIAKGKKEKHAEQVQFAAFKTFCDTTTSQKQTAIKEANEQIDVLAADIEKAKSDAEALGEDIAVLDEDIATWTGDMKACTKVREIENTDYTATHKDYTDSITALEEAITTLKSEAKDTAAGASLMQVSDKLSRSSATTGVRIPEQMQRAMAAFLQDVDNDNLASLVQVGAPEAKAFEFQSQGLVDMLAKLLAKFEDERDQLEKDEKNGANAYAMLTMDLKGQIDRAEQARNEKTEAKAKAGEAEASATGDLTDTTTTRDEDTKYLTDLTATCEQKASAFAERQQLRAEEIEAIGKAKEILSSGAVAGNAEKHLPSMVQTKARSLAQLRAEVKNPVQLRVASFLKDAGTRIDSRILAVLATRVSDDPMKKVKKMIKDLIVKLMEEAHQEAEQKGYCDAEMMTNEQTRTEKTAAVETLTAEVGELEASIAKLTEEITELTKAVADGEAAVAKATTIRGEEKEKNTATIKDAQEAQTAVAQALSVLKEFYDKAAQATSFVQQKSKEPEIFGDEPYKGMGAENGGVVGMIEVIQSDFARVESETTSAESAAQEEYDQFIADTAVDKTGQQSDIDHKTSKKQNQETALEEAKTSLDGEKKELDAAMAYWEKLKPSCVDAVESYEDRVARRKAEIESLQEALKILTES